MIQHIQSGWLVLVLALVFGAGLAGVQTTLGPIIAQNEKDETYRQIPSLVLGSKAVAGQAITTEGNTISVGEKSKLNVEPIVVETPPAPYKAYRVTQADSGRLVGWVVRAAGPGYGGTITALLGFDAKASTIRSVYVLSQTETPGLGSKIAGPWNEQFDNKSAAEPLVVVKASPKMPNEIKAISGATISSNAITSLVNKAVERFQKDLAGGQIKAAEETPHAE
jgi:Na+-translocating ferredoxin:NAD+ oxidoreductase subunit G